MAKLEMAGPVIRRVPRPPHWPHKPSRANLAACEAAATYLAASSQTEGIQRAGFRTVDKAVHIDSAALFDRISVWPLCGPFHGTNYTQHPQGIEMSSLQVSEQLALKVVWVSELDAPVLSLVSSDGEPIWSRLLTLELPLTDGSVRHGRIKTLTLKHIVRAADGYKVMVACDWYWGGNERGIIRLGEDHSFRDMSLGW